MLIVCVLVYLGFLATRFSRHLRLPVVTSFLLLGVVVGPEGLNLVSNSVNHSLRIVEPIALGMITFAAGEQLHFGDIRLFSKRHYLAIGLETVLPVVLVAAGAWLVTRRLEVALPVGAIAGTTGLATVMSTLKESGAKGHYAKLLGFATASDNSFAILAFSLFLPWVTWMETGGNVGSQYADKLIGMVASVAIGLFFGFVVSRLIRNMHSPQELSMFVLANVLMMVGVTYYFGFSVLLAGLTMGATTVNLTREVRDRDRAFAALGTLEFPVMAMFFLWAGSSLHLRALAGIGLLFVVYLLARVVGKLAGPLAVAWRLRKQESESRRFVGLGMSLLPQAGAAVGLAVVAGDSLPVNGQTILATVLGAVVVFELVGPIGVHWASRYVGEARDTPRGRPLTLEEAIRTLEDRKARLVAITTDPASAATLEVPRALASRLEGDLLVIPVTHGRVVDVESVTVPFRAAGDREASETHSDPNDPGNGAAILLDDRHLGQFLDVVREQRPDVLFVSLPRDTRRLLGSADALSARIGCPVFEIPGGQRRTWLEGVSLPVALVDGVTSKFSLFRQRLQLTRIPKRRSHLASVATAPAEERVSTSSPSSEAASDDERGRKNSTIV